MVIWSGIPGNECSSPLTQLYLPISIKILNMVTSDLWWSYRDKGIVCMCAWCFAVSWLITPFSSILVSIKRSNCLPRSNLLAQGGNAVGIRHVSGILPFNLCVGRKKKWVRKRMRLQLVCKEKHKKKLIVVIQKQVCKDYNKSEFLEISKCFSWESWKV